MIYFLTIEKFLTHAIDYFTKDELIRFRYKILSADIIHEGRLENVKMINQFLLPSDVLMDEFVDLNSVKKEYYDDMDQNLNHIELLIMQEFKQHLDLLIITTEKERKFVQLFIDYLYDKFNIPVIDLNTLFENGELHELEWDPNKIHDRIHKMNKAIKKSIYETQSSTYSGRLKLMDDMSKKEKIKKLKSLGVDVDDNETEKNINDMLLIAWVEDE